jgi:uncharacterized protein YodC (DUF2158 family)
LNSGGPWMTITGHVCDGPQWIPQWICNWFDGAEVSHSLVAHSSSLEPKPTEKTDGRPKPLL